MSSGIQGGINAGGNVDLDVGDVGMRLWARSNVLQLNMATKGKNDGTHETLLDGWRCRACSCDWRLIEELRE